MTPHKKAETLVKEIMTLTMCDFCFAQICATLTVKEILKTINPLNCKFVSSGFGKENISIFRYYKMVLDSLKEVKL